MSFSRISQICQFNAANGLLGGQKIIPLDIDSQCMCDDNEPAIFGAQLSDFSIADWKDNIDNLNTSFFEENFGHFTETDKDYIFDKIFDITWKRQIRSRVKTSSS